MAITATIELLGTVTGLPSGTLTFRPAAVVLAAAVGTLARVNIPNASSVALAVPTGASYIGITPPAGAVQGLLVRSSGGSGTGFAVAATNPSLLSLNTGTTTVTIENPGGVAINGVEIVFL